MDLDAIAEKAGGFRWQQLPPSAQMLLASNALTIIVAIFFGLDPAEMIWVYWLESVVIGVFTVLTFITMGLSFKAGEKQTGKVGSPAGAYGYAIFFCIHYGMFHVAYALFLSVMPWFSIQNPDYAGMGITAAILTLSHGYSFWKNVLGNPAGLVITQENVTRVMNAPYPRIIPMHLTIIFSGFLMIPLSIVEFIVDVASPGAAAAGALWLVKLAVLVMFMGIKTAADLYTHLSRYRQT